MKHPITTVAICLLAACSQGSTPPEVQSYSSSATVPTAAASTAALHKPSVTESLERHVVHLGPFDLPARTTPEKMRDKPARATFHVDQAMWITGFEPSVTDGAGNSLPGELVHLAIMANHGETNPLCETENTGNPIAAVTSTMKSINIPNGFGYAVLPDDALEVTLVLHNPTDQNFNDVHFSFTLVGTPMQTSQPVQDVAPLLLDSDPCHHAPLAVEPGGYVHNTHRFTIPAAGSVIGAYGLLQDFGVEVGLQKESEKTPFWQAAAKINEHHQITALPTYDGEPVPLKAGDGIILSVSYQNSSDQWLNDATAAAMIYMARGSQDTSPAASKPYHRKSAEPAVAVQSLLMK